MNLNLMSLVMVEGLACSLGETGELATRGDVCGFRVWHSLFVWCAIKLLHLLLGLAQARPELSGCRWSVQAAPRRARAAGPSIDHDGRVFLWGNRQREERRSVYENTLN
jgi:hypothetical protein